MTTIAYRDGVLASDSRATWGEGTISKCVKMWRTKSKVKPILGDVLIGGAGDLYAFLLFKDWIESGGEPTLHDRGVEEQNDFDALIVHKSGIYGANRLCRIDRIHEPFWSAGSGCHCALAAMHCGLSAEEAVRIAHKIDPFTDANIVTLSLSAKKRK